jgi:hypothetical protein
LIVHASYPGSGNFVVKSRAADGTDTAIVAIARGGYEGTFPVGFVDQRGAHTTALDVEGDGPWHLDIASASLAPRLTNGIRGDGDAVLLYQGPKARFRVTHAAAAAFLLRTYGRSNLTFTRGSGRVDGIVELGAGPLFIAVTTVGPWSIAATTRAAP